MNGVAMDGPALGRRVALLARPGMACDKLRGALSEAGAQLVLEGDPVTLDPATLDAAQAQVLLVALDAQTEDALDRFDAVLCDPAIEVIFEEAELAARREGWEAARWVRHLAAKLHRHGDVLPPGGEQDQDDDSAADVAGNPQTELVAAERDPAVAAHEDQTEVAYVGGFDPVAAETGGLELQADAIELLSIDAVAAERDPAQPANDDQTEVAYGGFDPVVAETGGLDSQAAEIAPFAFGHDFEMSLDDLRSERDVSASHEQVVELSFDSDLVSSPRDTLKDAGAVTSQTDAGLLLDDTGDVAGGMELSLDEVPAELRGFAENTAGGREADHRFRHDLEELDRRIASLELVDDRVVKGPVQANGAVLVLSGIGGPDAVRQLLGALPEDFARPVLVQQRLDGGRFDKLVAQMQRATPLRVKLAEVGVPAIAGVVYILPTGVGISVGDIGIQFIAGDDGALAALPSADSAVLLLSGSDPAVVDAVMNHSWAGALVAGQAPDGCYDAAAPNALVARGGGTGQPAELALRLAERWRS